MKFSLLILFAFITTYSLAQNIKVAGTLRGIMQEADFTTKMNLDTAAKKNLYGLGPVAGLKGEMIVLNGDVYTSTKNSAGIADQKNQVSQAAMLVYSYVKNWKPVILDLDLENYQRFEKFVADTLKSLGFDAVQPVCFRLETNAAQVNYHIIDWKEGVAHTPDNHKQFAYTGELTNSPVVLLGFYSTQHMGVFTHHTSNLHVHVLDSQTQRTGHLDNIKIKGKVTLYIAEL